MEVLPISAKITEGGDETRLTLRLDSRHVEELVKELGKEISEVMNEAATNTGTMVKVLNAAIRHKFNHNPEGLDGYDLYDALADAGYKGATAWMRLSIRIAEVSGLTSKDMANAVIRSAEKGEADVIRELENSEKSSSASAETADADDPTKAEK